MESNGNRVDARLVKIETTLTNLLRGQEEIKRDLKGYELGALRQKVETLSKFFWLVAGAAVAGFVSAMFALIEGSP